MNNAVAPASAHLILSVSHVRAKYSAALIIDSDDFFKRQGEVTLRTSGLPASCSALRTNVRSRTSRPRILLAWHFARCPEGSVLWNFGSKVPARIRLI
jgi:hypothetical protein